jgi:hypothetical protein
MESSQHDAKEEIKSVPHVVQESPLQYEMKCGMHPLQLLRIKSTSESWNLCCHQI